MPYKSHDEESYLLGQIAKLQREYQSMVQPYVDRLVYLESLKPPDRSFTLLTKSQFNAACVDSWKRFSTPVTPEQ